MRLLRLTKVALRGRAAILHQGRREREVAAIGSAPEEDVGHALAQDPVRVEGDVGPVLVGVGRARPPGAVSMPIPGVVLVSWMGAC